MKSKREVLKQYKRDRGSALRNLRQQYKNTRECNEFYAGDFVSYCKRLQFPDGQTAMVQINKVQPFINAVAGFMAQNRRDSDFLARIQDEPSQKAHSQYANALKDYVRENANADQEETQQDVELLIGGYGAVDTALSWDTGYATREPNGEIVMSVLDSEKVWWDASARKTNLLDAKFVGYDKEFDLEDAMELMDADEDAFEDAKGEDGDSFEFNPRGGDYSAIREIPGLLDWTDEEKKSVNVSFYQWYDIEPFYRAHNPLFDIQDAMILAITKARMDAIAAEQTDTNFRFKSEDEILVCDGETKKKLEALFEDRIEFFESKRKTFYGAVISGNTVFRVFPLQSQQGFTIKFKTGYFDKKKKIWFGMVNSMKDPVLYYNKALTELIYIIGANSKGGWMYETGAVENVREFEAKVNKTNTSVEVAKNALVDGRVKEKKSPFIPTGYENVIGLADAAMTEVTGIDRAFFGFIQGDESGVLYKRMIRQATTILARFFDAVMLYKKEHSRMLLDLMRELVENNEGAMFHAITGGGKVEYLEMSATHLAAEFSVTIQDAPQSADEKEEKGRTLFGLGDKLQATGDAAAKQVYAVGVKYLDLDMEDEQKVVEALTGQGVNPEVEALKQQVQALTSKDAEVQRKFIESGVALNSAKVDETMAKVHKLAADTVKTMEDAEQTSMETSLAKTSQTVSVSI